MEPSHPHTHSKSKEAHDGPAEIFQIICMTFKEELSEEENSLFKHCPSPQSLIESIKAKIESHNVNRNRLATCCDKIQKFSSKLKPFFDIINICVQNTQYAAWTWGAIRLVFLLGENYFSFLEKLSMMFEKMAQRLPAYEVYVEKLSSLKVDGIKPHKRLVDALGLVFLDIVQFCLDACRLFSGGKHGKVIRHHLVRRSLLRTQFALRMAWQPFDLRFEGIIARFEEHTKLFEFEMQVSHMCEVLDGLERLRLGKEKAIADIKKNIGGREEGIERQKQEIGKRRRIVTKIEEGQKTLSDEERDVLLQDVGVPSLESLGAFIETARDLEEGGGGPVGRLERRIVVLDARIELLRHEIKENTGMIGKKAVESASLEEKYSKKMAEKIHLESNLRDWQMQVIDHILQFEMLKKEQQADARRLRIRHLKEWLDAPNWEEVFEKSQRDRIPGTGTWVFENPDYERWLSTQFFSENLEDLENRTLIIRGKPGYGKTALCSAVIDSFRDHLTKPKSVAFSAFYYFDAQRSRTNTPGHCMRAILTQLVHEFQHKDESIDTASFLMGTTGRGQRVATESEVCSILRLLLRSIKKVVLVIDAIDECSDQRTFLRYLRNVASQPSNCAIILFSRPSCQLLASVFSKCQHIRLEKSMNINDIQCYLEETFQNMASEELLPRDLDCKNAVIEVAERADGMFLWATLFSNYLQSCALTVDDRLEAINQYSYLTGLDALYTAIITDITTRFPEPREQANIRRAFQWVAGATRPLLVEELRIASGIKPGQSTQQSRLIPGFNRSLAEFSGSLLEISQDETVRFIHLSALEYLTGSNKEHLDLTGRFGFGIPFHETQRVLASSCLSYLSVDIPAEPLSGSPDIVPDKEIQHKRFPLLSYVLNSWTKHVCAGMEIDYNHGPLIDQDETLYQLVSMMTSILNDKRRISMFIETSWLFDIQPGLGDIPQKLASLYESLPAKKIKTKFLDSREIKNMVSSAEALSKDLRSLNDAWGLVLKDHPNEIWQPSISAFNPSRFWKHTKDATFRPIDSNESLTPLKFLVIESQVSQCGLYLGQIKLFPSVSVLFENGDLKFDSAQTNTCTSRAPEAERRAKGWTARYEIWFLQTQAKVFECSIDVPTDELERLIYNAMFSYKWPYFHFPVAFSNDLRRAAILGCVIEVKEFGQNSITENPMWRPQFSLQQIGLWHIDRGCNLGFSTESVQVRFSPVHVYRLKFSPCGSHLLVIHGLDTMYQDYLKQGWVLEIFSLKNCDDSKTSGFEYRKSNVLHPRKQTEMSSFNKYIAFHPSLPILALSRENDCILWAFDIANGLQTVQLTSKALRDITFSSCGLFLCATAQNDTSLVRSNNLTVQDEILRIDVSAQIETLIPLSSNIRPGSALIRHTESSRPFAPAAITQTSNAIMMVPDQHSASNTVSILRDVSEAGAVVHSILTDDGISRFSVLARIPDALRSQTHTTLLPQATGNPDMVTLVLNKASQTRYSVNDADSSSVLPAIYERVFTSLPVFTATRTNAIKDEDTESDCSGCKRKKRLYQGRRENYKRSCQ